MEILLPDEIKTCITLLNANHFECFVVGGAVRDALLHRENHDYDVSTNALPSQMHDVFKDYPVFDTGLKHGTVTVVINHVHIEITTYRIESNYSDHRHPDHVSFTSKLKDDCARRDLTINALAYHPTLGLQDFFFGIEDLNHHIIRTVGNPDERFHEDALRILRAIRFASQLDFRIDQVTSSSIISHANDLNYIAIERITEETNKIITSTCPGIIIYEYKTVFSVFLENMISISKEQCLSIDTSKNDLALRYAILGFYIGLDSIKNLRLPNQTMHIIQKLNTYANLPYDTSFDIRYLLYKLDENIEDYLEFKSIIDSNFDLSYIQKEIQNIQNHHECTSLKQLELTGKDLQHIGITGSSIKETLESCLLKVMHDELQNNKKELLDYARKL